MNQITIDATLVVRLVADAFPDWAGLPVCEVEQQGWDNLTFRLGDHLGVRLPSAERYAAQIEKEQTWLARLAPSLAPVAIPLPVAIGAPGEGYPWRWSVFRWIAGETAAAARIDDKIAFARALGRFLNALQAIDASGGPVPGAHSFFRGGSLAVYDAQTREAIARLSSDSDARAALAIWEVALASEWSGRPVWVHGDFSPANLVVEHGALAGVIDFGCLCIGDPACDLAIRWSFIDAAEAAAFRGELQLDAGTWRRARAWCLWKNVILLTGLVNGPARDVADAPRVFSKVLREDA